MRKKILWKVFFLSRIDGTSSINRTVEVLKCERCIQSNIQYLQYILYMHYILHYSMYCKYSMYFPLCAHSIVRVEEKSEKNISYSFLLFLTPFSAPSPPLSEKALRWSKKSNFKFFFGAFCTVLYYRIRKLWFLKQPNSAWSTADFVALQLQPICKCCNRPVGLELSKRRQNYKPQTTKIAFTINFLMIRLNLAAFLFISWTETGPQNDPNALRLANWF